MSTFCPGVSDYITSYNPNMASSEYFPAPVPSPSPPAFNVTAAPVDLHRDLEAAFDGPADLLTTSALLDLVSDDWLNRLAVEAAARRLPVYAALSYDGRAELAPSDTARQPHH